MPPTLIDEFSDCASTLRPRWRHRLIIARPFTPAVDALLKTAQLAEQSRRQLVTGQDRLQAVRSMNRGRTDLSLPRSDCSERRVSRRYLIYWIFVFDSAWGRRRRAAAARFRAEAPARLRARRSM